MASSNSSKITVNGIGVENNGLQKAINKTQLNLLQKDTVMSKARLMRNEMKSINKKLIGRIRRNQLSGQKLKRKSGRLQASLKQETTMRGALIQSQVYSSEEYGQAFDVGSRGIQAVRAHLENRKSIFGRPTRPYERFVNQYTRRYEIKAKQFVNEEAMRMLPEIIREARDIFLKK